MKRAACATALVLSLVALPGLSGAGNKTTMMMDDDTEVTFHTDGSVTFSQNIGGGAVVSNNPRRQTSSTKYLEDYPPQLKKGSTPPPIGSSPNPSPFPPPPNYSQMFDEMLSTKNNQ